MSIQNFADSRVRVKGRFVKKEDESILVELNALTGLAPTPEDQQTPLAPSLMPLPTKTAAP